MLQIPVLFAKSDDHIQNELIAIARNNFAECSTTVLDREQTSCLLSIGRAQVGAMVQDLENSRYSQLRLLANRLIVEADSRYKSASRRHFS